MSSRLTALEAETKLPFSAASGLGVVAIEDAEIYSDAIPIAMRTDKLHWEAAVIELWGAIFGSAEGGVTDITLNFYHCPNADANLRATEPFATQALDMSDAAGAPGADLVANGTFAADTDWTKGSGWSIAAGVSTWVVGSGDFSDIEQAVAVTDGTEYMLSVDVTAGSCNAFVGAQKLGIDADDRDPRDSGILETGGGVGAGDTHVVLFERDGGAANLKFRCPSAGESPAYASSVIDNAILLPVTPYRFCHVLEVPAELASGLVVGVLPGGDITGTYLYARMRRYHAVT